MPLFDSEPALAEGERKVKRGMTGVVSAVPRIHLPTVRSRLLPRHPHLPPTAWAPQTPANSSGRPWSRPWREVGSGRRSAMVAFLCVVLEPCQEDAPCELKPLDGSAQSGKDERNEHPTHQIRDLCRECITAWGEMGGQERKAVIATRIGWICCNQS